METKFSFQASKRVLRGGERRGLAAKELKERRAEEPRATEFNHPASLRAMPRQADCTDLRRWDEAIHLPEIQPRNTLTARKGIFSWAKASRRNGNRCLMDESDG